jgi:hypothetical protein
MPSLHEVQQAMLQAIGGYDTDAAARLVYANGIDPQRRLRVYRHNMLANLGGALRAVYPAIERLVGKQFFDLAAHHYIAAHPSASGDIHHFGARFGGFLADFEPARELPYLEDVAAMEWAYHEVFHAADAAGFQLEELAAVPESRQPSLRLSLNPASRLLESRYPVVRIWQAGRRESEPVETINLDDRGEQVLVLRCGDHVEVQRLTPGEHSWLMALNNGATLAAASEQALAADAGFDLALALHRHVTQRTLTGFNPPRN